MRSLSRPWSLACGLVLLAAIAPGRSLPAADDGRSVLPGAIDGHKPSEMMPRYIKTKVREALDRRKAEYEKLKTPEQIVAHQRKMRTFFIDQLGGLPERTPLNARVVDRLQRDGYRIEKVIYESQPGLFVTALLYLPETEPPYPGVLVPCGHSKNGKAGATYQQVSILLARNGMAALCFDPIEQGERCQLLDRKGKPRVMTMHAHHRVGVGSILLGRNTATFNVWDGIRGIDYLVSRKEIDPARIGCTGNSGGGTLTAYLMALDDRIRCAAPSCYLTSFERLLDTIGPQDAEQNIHGQIGFGMDHADYIHMRAPRPTLLCTATHDFFDIRGSWTAFREAKRIYERLGFAERVDLIETDNVHGFHSPLRVGAVRWLRRWLLGVDDAITERPATLLSDAEARCTPKGQAVLLDGAKTTYDLNGEYESQLAVGRREFWKKADRAAAMDAVRRVTGIRPLAELPEPEVEHVGSVNREGYSVEKLVLRSEPGIRLPGLLFMPETDKPPTDFYLYLDDRGTRAAADEGGPIDKLVRQGHPVLAVDVRGIGETAHKATSRPDYAKYLGQEWSESTQAYLLGTSYLAMRTEDILICSRWLADRKTYGNMRRVRVVATGTLGPPALHAAALEPGVISRSTLRGGLTSWAAVVRTPFADLQYVNVVHGALKVYDLPDLVGSLPETQVETVAPK